MLLAAFSGVGVVAYVAKLANGHERSFSSLLPVAHFVALGAVLSVVPFVAETSRL